MRGRKGGGSDNGPDLSRALRVARAQGVFNVLGGLWPLVSMRSFETVFPPPKVRYLEQTIGGLLVTVGLAQLRATRSTDSLAMARRLGLCTAATLTAVDLAYAPRRIGAAYLVDAAMQAGWTAAWARAGRLRRPA